MTNQQNIDQFAQAALDKANSIVQALTEAAANISAAGPAPAFISPEWSDRMTEARQALSQAIDELDSGGYDQSPMAQAAMDLHQGVHETYNDYLDAHQADYYDLWLVDHHTFLLDTRAGQRVLAFDNEQDAANWLRYHHNRGISTLNPKEVPVVDLHHIRTSDVLDAIAGKDQLRNRTDEIREHLRKQDDHELQEARQSVEKLSPEQRERLADLLPS